MWMDVGLDTGDILLIEKTKIRDDDNSQTLHDRLAEMGAEALLKAITLIEKGKAPRIKQDSSLSTYAKKLKKEETMKSYKEFLQGLEEKLIGKQKNIDKNKNGKVDAQDFKILQKENAPVAPVPDKKYIKGTPENKALKASRKPINGMPTNVKEEAKKEDPPFDGPYKSTFKKPNNPSRTGMDSARSLAQRAMDQVSKKKPVKEAKDEQEYGYEGDMALNQLATLTRCAEMIKDTLKPDTDLPEWVQSKITLATDYIQTAADYMHSEMNEAAAVTLKVNHAGDTPHEEKWEPAKKIKKAVKKAIHIEYHADPTKLQKKPIELPRNFSAGMLYTSVPLM